MGRQDGDEGVDSEDAGPSRPGLPIDPYRIRRALTRGKWWLLSAALVGSIAGYLVGKFGIQRNYEASATVQYVGQVGDPQYEIQRDLPGLVAAAQSEEVLFELRARMNDMPAANLPALRAMVIVVSDPGNGLVTFTSGAESPERAALMTNTALQSFLDFHLQRRRDELDAEIVSIVERTQAAEAEVNGARQTYDTFRSAQGITDLSSEQEAAIDRAADLRSQADLGHAEVESLEARVLSLRAELARTDQTHAVSSGASTAQRRLSQLRQALADARGQGLGVSHPRVQALQRQVDAAQRAAGGGTTTTRSEANPVYTQIQTTLQETVTELEGARQRVASLEDIASSAQERTARFSAIEGQAANLLAQVNVKQALLNELNGQRAALDDHLSDVQTGFRTVAEARPPDTAVPSKKKYAVAAGLPIAFVTIMLAMLLFRELRGIAVHTAAEVAFWGNGPVIGTTKWPREPRALLDLIADLDDFAPDAKGTMLIVGGSDADRELATEIANQLNLDWTASTHIEVPVMGALPSPSGHDSSPPSASGYYDDDDVLSGEIHDGPTEFSVPQHAELALLDLPTEVERPLEAALGDDRLICTAWTQGSEGQALRRAARLADRVLIVVTSGGLKASELATIRTRLGVEDTIGYVLTGVSDEVSRLPDRAGMVEKFWTSEA